MGSRSCRKDNQRGGMGSALCMCVYDGAVINQVVTLWDLRCFGFKFEYSGDNWKGFEQRKDMTSYYHRINLIIVL